MPIKTNPFRKIPIRTNPLKRGSLEKKGFKCRDSGKIFFMLCFPFFLKILKK